MLANPSSVVPGVVALRLENIGGTVAFEVTYVYMTRGVVCRRFVGVFMVRLSVSL